MLAVRLSSRFASWLFRWKAVLTKLSLSCHCFSQVARVDMSWLRLSSMLFRSRSTLSNARSSAYPYFFVVVYGKYAMYMLKSRGERMDPCGTPLLIRLGLFCWPSLVFMTTLRFEMSSAINIIICRLGSIESSFKMRPCRHTVS